MATTQLSLIGTPGGRYSFSAKTAATVIVVVTPGGRTLVVQSESRKSVIYNENRAYIIFAEARTKYIYK